MVQEPKFFLRIDHFTKIKPMLIWRSLNRGLKVLNFSSDMVVHICNPGYLGGRDRIVAV
jgi:hypothetical protein